MGKLFSTVTVRRKISTDAKAAEEDFDEEDEVKDSKIAIKRSLQKNLVALYTFDYKYFV